ncbi:hypothetical protein ABZ876_37140 [Streptomyces sp. NPDC046931]|uniref:hypothetical protein n=1 Tax=Streptomyces sp. NPDC046931 TaxID=3154806 RepID=UPI0033DAEF8D
MPRGPQDNYLPSCAHSPAGLDCRWKVSISDTQPHTAEPAWNACVHAGGAAGGAVELKEGDDMSLPDLTKPVVSDDIARFGGNGQPSPVAKINYNVPLPGAYTINRIVPMEIPGEWFSEGSTRLGSSLIDLGVVQGDENSLRGIDIERLAQFYRRTLPPTARPSLRHVAKVDGDVEPLLTDATRPGSKGDVQRLAADHDTDALSVLERRQLVAEPDDVEVQRRRVRSYIDRLSDAQSAAIPAVANARVLPTISLPVQGPGHSIQELAVNPVAPPVPQLALVETWELRSFLGDYGLGRTVQTFSLLPGERTMITMQTWRTDAATREDATSIFDSSDIAAQSRFADSVTSETGSAFQDQGGWALSVSTSASASASFGIVQGSASVEAGFSANHQEASQRWASDISQAASEHANQTNNSRRQAVEQSSTTTTSSGTTTTTVREIANTNLRRVLNFVFRELNQTYETHVVLRDIKVAFYNGRAGSAEVVPLPDLRRLITRHFPPGRHAQVAAFVLGLCAERLDADGNPVAVLQKGERRDGRHYTWQDAALDDNGDLDFDGDPLSPKVHWRFKPGALTPGARRQIRGLITDTSEIVLRTDNIVVEALLGEADALDPYASALQALDLESRQADTAWRIADTRRLTDALALVSDLAPEKDKIDAWTKIFPETPEIEVVPVAAVSNDDSQ